MAQFRASYGYFAWGPWAGSAANLKTTCVYLYSWVNIAVTWLPIGGSWISPSPRLHLFLHEAALSGEAVNGAWRANMHTPYLCHTTLLITCERDTAAEERLPRLQQPVRSLLYAILSFSYIAHDREETWST